MKFQYIYSMTIEGRVFTHTVDYPLTLDIDITRDTLSSVNRAELTIYNLSQATRNDIFHVRYDTASTSFKRITINAGYATDSVLPKIFDGNIWEAGSYRQGVNFVTKIDAFDGSDAIINGQASITKPAGWNFKDLMATLVGTMPNAKLNAIGNIDVQNSRGVTVAGNSWDSIQRLAGDNYAFIDNAGVNILAENDFLVTPGDIPVISADTGLLDTPRFSAVIEGGTVQAEAKSLFYPQIVVGQRVYLQSSSQPAFNGYYQVRGVKHRGRISGAVLSDMTTIFNLWSGQEGLVAVNTISAEVAA